MLFKFALTEFKADREYRNVSDRTLTAYMNQLNEFHQYCVNHDVVNLEDCTASFIKQYLLHCKEKGNNPTTVNTKLHILKIFFNYFETEMEVFTPKTNPTKRIIFAKEEIKIEVFSDAHIKQMLRYYQSLKYRDKSLYAYRDYFMIIFLLGSACRIGETANLRWKDVDLVNQIITVNGKKRIASSIPMSDKLKAEFLEYRLFIDQHFPTMPEMVFTNRDGKPLTDNAIKCIFKHLKAIMNFKDVRLSGHTFRHTAAHRMLIAGADVGTIQKMLRHSNVSMTLRYFSLWGTALAEQNEKFNALNSFDL
ncbi:tyrosine-type recombinase/integrase [Paenibacillus aceti]|uniref:Tyrosine recombinase XerC n=2 Tax=Paenibacillus aceti TaxID=1820010 RepID=A0ABQ1VQD3_9BACL|nr:site-specific integrase [Paenibacillus aceti]GGF86405.1 tyrosine recombinase XerC [Paenibacillus aceti]